MPPQQQPSDASAFENTEDVQVIVPYATAAESPGLSEKPGGAETAMLLGSSENNDLQPEDLVAIAAGKTGAHTPTALKNAFTSDLGPSIAAAPKNASDSGPSTAVAPFRSAPRAEDMEDAEMDEMLPPEYKEVWGQRHTTDAADVEDAVVVQRANKSGTRADDVAP